MKSVIYETKGRAREFNELAINLFTGCGHQCIYCYGADVQHISKDQFENQPKPRITEEDIERSCHEWKDKINERRVLLCFVTDPYQPIEAETKLTRHAIEILHKNNINVHILTKGGLRSMRDFDLLTPDDAYATTLTLTNDQDSKMWERYADIPHNRIKALLEAATLGIETWVSFEPMIYAEETVELYKMTKDFVGHYKVGTMNYHPQGKNTNWNAFGWRIKKLMDYDNTKYYFKKDLVKEMGVRFENFKQTHVCI